MVSDFIKSVHSELVNDTNLPMFNELDNNEQLDILDILFSGQSFYVLEKVKAEANRIILPNIGTFVISDKRKFLNDGQNKAKLNNVNVKDAADKLHTEIYDKVKNGELGKTKRKKLQPVVLSNVNLSNLK